ncbi:hypothetical protein D3C72_1893980 [compost metagenome]
MALQFELKFHSLERPHFSPRAAQLEDLLHVNLGAVVGIAAVAKHYTQWLTLSQLFNYYLAYVIIKAGGKGVPIHKEHRFPSNRLLLNG